MPVTNRAVRERFKDDAISVVRAIKDHYAPALEDQDKGGQVLVWLLDLVERARANRPRRDGARSANE